MSTDITDITEAQNQLRDLQLRLAEFKEQARRLREDFADVKAQFDEETADLQARLDLATETERVTEDMARELVIQIAQATGEAPGVTGFGVQWRETLDYDREALLAFARAHAPDLLVLPGERAISEWVKAHTARVTDMEGEIRQQFNHEFGVETVPVRMMRRATATVSDKALLTALDEHRFNAMKGR